MTAVDEFHWWQDRSACKDAPLEMVDDAFARPGGPVGKAFAAQFCRRCPVGRQCLRDAMRNGEDGVWGGTTPGLRTRHGSPNASARATSLARRSGAVV